MKTTHLISIIFSLFVFMLQGISLSAQEKPRYANPEVFEVNREPAHAFSLPVKRVICFVSFDHAGNI